jgi:hypothetical protein
MKGHLDWAAREFANAITGVPKPTVSELALPVPRYGLEIIDSLGKVRAGQRCLPVHR